MKKTILAIIRNEQQAQQIVDHLRSANLSIQDVSIIITDQKGKTSEVSAGKSQSKSGISSSWTKEGEVAEESYQAHQHVGDRTEKGQASRGTVALSGSLGRLGNATRVTLPGAGTVIIAGPLKNAFGGSARTTSVGTTGVLIGTLVGFGFPDADARRFEEKLKKGFCLIAFQAEDTQDLDRAKDVFKKAGVEDVTTGAATQKKARV